MVMCVFKGRFNRICGLIWMEKMKKEVKGGDANMLGWVTRMMVVPLLEIIRVGLGIRFERG